MRSTESGFSPAVYLEAAQARIQTARRLLGDATPDYVGASYFAGVAVECLFWAYRMRAGVDDTGRHNLRIQAAQSGLYNTMTRREQDYLADLVDEVNARWQNNHRYRSETALRNFVTINRLFIIEGSRRTRTDALLWSANRLLDAAAEIVEIGIKQWQSLLNV